MYAQPYALVQGDEELAAIGVRRIGICASHQAAVIELESTVELIFEWCAVHTLTTCTHECDASSRDGGRTH
jgi:hypothetical protein